MIRHSGFVTLAVSLMVMACGGAGGPSTSPSAPTAGGRSTASALPAPASASATQTTGATSQISRPTGGETPLPTPAVTPSAVISWSELDVSDGPSAREDHTWTLAADGLVAYLFGGRSADGSSDELWQFDLGSSSWTRIEADNAAPEARFGHTATWVPDVGLVVWSGQGRSGFFDDIWAYDAAANSWRQLPSTGAIPPARYGSCASLGPDGQLWISHGFTEDSGRFSDTRSYDFATGMWTDHTPKDAVPVKRCLHDCFWSRGDRLILYGGQTTGVPALGDLWSFDPGTGSWSQAPEQEAPARQLYGLATTADAAVVFGGGSADRAYLDDTWRLDPAVPSLSVVEPGSAPPARSGAAVIAAQDTGDVLLFGGQGSDGLLDDMWVLSGAL